MPYGCIHFYVSRITEQRVQLIRFPFFGTFYEITPKIAGFALLLFFNIFVCGPEIMKKLVPWLSYGPQRYALLIASALVYESFLYILVRRLSIGAVEDET